MKKRLERDVDKAVFAGVLAGLAEYFGQDPVFFRVVAIIFLIVTGFFPGILFYVVAWVLMPKKDQSKQPFDYEAK